MIRIQVNEYRPEETLPIRSDPSHPPAAPKFAHSRTLLLQDFESLDVRAVIRLVNEIEPEAVCANCGFLRNEHPTSKGVITFLYPVNGKEPCDSFKPLTFELHQEVTKHLLAELEVKRGISRSLELARDALEAATKENRQLEAKIVRLQKKVKPKRRSRAR